MLIIHMADIHLDSRLGERYKREQGERRNREILTRFSAAVDYAGREGAEAVLISGDLFDSEKTKKETRDTVSAVIRNHPGIRFFYLRGNHDRTGVLSGYELPNLFTFGKEYKAYRLRNVTIGGVELSRENASVLSGLHYSDPDGIHILMLHGSAGEYRKKDDATEIPLRELKNRNIDYLALGHIHSYRAFSLDSRGTAVYPGCLEPRGFDEPGEKGFVRIEIDEENGRVSHCFVPFSERTLRVLPVEVTDCGTTEDCFVRITAALSGHPVSEEDMLLVRLSGTKPVTVEFDTEYLAERLRDLFYLVSVEDYTELLLLPEDYEYDRSLKGEFVRLVLSDGDLSEEEKKQIAGLGLRALDGGKIA